MDANGPHFCLVENDDNLAKIKSGNRQPAPT